MLVGVGVIAVSFANLFQDVESVKMVFNFGETFDIPDNMELVLRKSKVDVSVVVIGGVIFIIVGVANFCSVYFWKFEEDDIIIIMTGLDHVVTV
jgi:phosphatidylglycerophosphatase A